MNEKKNLNIEETFALAVQNHKKNNLQVAENLYKKILNTNPNSVGVHNNLGMMYKELEEYKKALDCYKKAILINPKIEYIHHNIANVFLAIGNFAEAKKHFKQSIKFNPDFIVTHRSLSRITKYTNNEEHFKELKKIYKKASSNDFEKKIELGYALGKAYSDTKSFDKSFAHYKEANFLQRKKINFSIKLEKKKFKEVKNTYNKELLRKPRFIPDIYYWYASILHYFS